MMIKHRSSCCRLIGWGCLATTVLLLAQGCSSAGDDTDFLYEQASAYRGGALYDKWWKVPKVKEAIEPGATLKTATEEKKSSFAGDNPLYLKAPAANTRRGSQTWRCKECHGWDNKGKDGAYGSGSHESGFPGIFAGRGKSVSELFGIIKDGRSSGIAVPDGHAFGKVLSNADIADLVKFVREGTVDTTKVIDSSKKGIGAKEDGKKLFGESCAACHGVDGKKINFKAGSDATEFLPNLAHGNPWEFVHKVRFGQPDGKMPNGAVKGYVLKDVGDILVYAQSLVPAGLEEASASRGGLLYDTWWKVKGTTAPTTDNPLYLTAPDPNKRRGTDTWRCKECHGWDYKGKDGAYGSGSHKTGFPGIIAAQKLTVANLKAIIGQGKKTNGSTIAGHAFEGKDLLSSADVADLSYFILTQVIETNAFIVPATKRGTGNATLGASRFAANCATCHGVTGMRINFHHDDAVPEAEYIGDIARDNPWELLHKLRFGQPGSAAEAKEMEEEFPGLKLGRMPNMFDSEYSAADVSALLTYAMTLPGSKERGGRAWDQWWKTADVKEAIEPGKSVTDAAGKETKSSLPADNPLYLAAPVANSRRGSQTWRCKECHGWDYRGKDGAYASGGHKTGFPGVFAARGKDAKVLYDALFSGKFDNGKTDPNHAFGKVLGDAVTRDVINFMVGSRDVEKELIFLKDGANGKKAAPKVTFEATMKERTRNGSLTLGQAKFAATCAQCHGRDGKKINFDAPNGVEYLPDVARGNPWEFTHKVTYGQPGTTMPNAAGSRYSVDNLADILWYAQQLAPPAAPPPAADAGVDASPPDIKPTPDAAIPDIAPSPDAGVDAATSDTTPSPDGGVDAAPDA